MFYCATSLYCVTSTSRGKSSRFPIAIFLSYWGGRKAKIETSDWQSNFLKAFMLNCYRPGSPRHPARLASAWHARRQGFFSTNLALLRWPASRFGGSVPLPSPALLVSIEVASPKM
jgi:hypothetical protein